MNACIISCQHFKLLQLSVILATRSLTPLDERQSNLPRIKMQNKNCQPGCGVATVDKIRIGSNSRMEKKKKQNEKHECRYRLV